MIGTLLRWLISPHKIEKWDDWRLKEAVAERLRDPEYRHMRDGDKRERGYPITRGQMIAFLKR